MKSDINDLTERVERLPQRERARLALRLLESLHPGSDEDVEQLWLDEAEKRLREHESSGAEPIEAWGALEGLEDEL